MDQKLGMREEKCLVWSTEKPSFEYRSRKSPVFSFQDCEGYFELTLHPGKYAYYQICIRSNEQFLEFPRCFDVTVCIKNSEFSADFCNKVLKVKSLNQTFEISTLSKEISDFNIRQILTFVFIFHDDIGLTLLLDKENHASKSTLCTCLESLSQDFGQLLDEGLNHDMELKCGEESLKAHSNILCTRSKVFKTMLQSNMEEGQTRVVKIQDMEADLLKQFLRYLYTGKLPEMTIESAKSFYAAGDKYEVTELMKHCADFLTENLTEEKAYESLILADRHSDRRFKEDIIAFILDKKIPLQHEQWLVFCEEHPKLAIEVLNRVYTSLNDK